jgi:hypothetical protein
MDATLKAALQGAAPTTFTAVSIAISGGATIRLVSGGVVTIGGNVYSAEDATYGTLGGVETIADGADGQATRCTITLFPPSSSAITALAAATAQGSTVIVYQGAVNTSTGASIGTVETLFTGELDFPKLAISANAYALTLECGTEESRLLEPNEERKLSDAFHQTCWSGELGLTFATRLTRKIYWRATDPSTSGVKGKGVKFLGVQVNA